MGNDQRKQSRAHHGSSRPAGHSPRPGRRGRHGKRPTGDGQSDGGKTCLQEVTLSPPQRTKVERGWGAVNSLCRNSSCSCRPCRRFSWLASLFTWRFLCRSCARLFRCQLRRPCRHLRRLCRDRRRRGQGARERDCRRLQQCLCPGSPPLCLHLCQCPRRPCRRPCRGWADPSVSRLSARTASVWSPQSEVNSRGLQVRADSKTTRRMPPQTSRIWL